MKCQNQTLNLLLFKMNLFLFTCVLFYSSLVCVSAYANVYFKTTIRTQNINIILIAGVPSSQALPGYLITAPFWYNWCASCVDSKPKKKTSGRDAMAWKPRQYPSPMPGSAKTQNRGASRHLARVTHSHQQELPVERHTTTVWRNGISHQLSAKATHDEWTLRQILVHLGLFSGIRRLNDEIVTFHAQ